MEIVLGKGRQTALVKELRCFQMTPRTVEQKRHAFWGLPGVVPETFRFVIRVTWEIMQQKLVNWWNVNPSTSWKTTITRQTAITCNLTDSQTIVKQLLLALYCIILCTSCSSPNPPELSGVTWQLPQGLRLGDIRQSVYQPQRHAGKPKVLDQYTAAISLITFASSILCKTFDVILIVTDRMS